jgi:hypothetical protein
MRWLFVPVEQVEESELKLGYGRTHREIVKGCYVKENLFQKFDAHCGFFFPETESM